MDEPAPLGGWRPAIPWPVPVRGIHGRSRVYLWDGAAAVDRANSFRSPPHPPGTLACRSADNLPAAARGLKGAKLGLVQSLSPIGRQHAVRGAGDRIFWDTLGRSEVAADKVVSSNSSCGDDHSQVDLTERGLPYQEQAQP
jgi:hypothetical protein